MCSTGTQKQDNWGWFPPPPPLQRKATHAFFFCVILSGRRKRSRNESDGENRWDRIRAKVKLSLLKMRRDTHFLQVKGGREREKRRAEGG